MNLKDIDRKLGDMMKEEKIVNKHLDIPFKNFMPGQIIQSSQFNDDMLDIEDKVNEIVDKHNLNVDKLHEHLDDKENPHEVNPHQIGTYEGSEIDAFIDDVKNGNLNDEAITNRVLADACVDNRVLVDGAVTLSKLDTNLGNQIDISNNMSIKERYTKLETDAIIQEKVGDGTYSKEQIDAKFEEYQAGTIVDGTIDVSKLKDSVGRKLDIEHNPSISNRYTKSEVNTLIARNGLPKDWGNLNDEVDDEIVTQSGLGSLPISDVMVCGEFKATETDVLNIKVQDVEFAKGEFSTLEERLDNVDTQLAHIVSKTKTNYLNVIEGLKRGFSIDEIINQCRTNGYIFYIANGDVLNIEKTLNLRHIKVVVEGTINVNFNGTGVLIGSNSTSPMSFKTYIYAITHTNYEEGDISVQIQGVLNGDIEIQYARKVKLWADGNDSTIDSISYSKFTLGTVYNLEINSNKNATNIGWITECIFYGGRYLNILIDGNFPHEELIFIKPCLENGVLTMNQGVNCRFIHMRNEDSSGNFSRFKIRLGEKTHGNKIELGAVESGWSSIYMTDYLKSIGAIVDNGRENNITNQISEQYKEVNIFDIMANVTLKKNWCKYNLPNADTDRIVLNDSLTFINVKNYASFFKKTFPVGGIKRFKIDYEGINDYGDNIKRGYNVSILCYDKNKNLITKQSISSLNIAHYPSNGAHTFEVPIEGTKHFLITNNDVYYIKMNIFAQGDSKIIKVRNIALFMYCNHNDEKALNILKESIKRNIYRTGFLSKSNATDIETLKNDYNKLIDMLFKNGVIGELQTVNDINYIDYNALEKFYLINDI